MDYDEGKLSVTNGLVRGTHFFRGGRTLIALECGRALCMYGWLQRCQEIAPSTQHALCVHRWLQRCQEIAPSTQHALYVHACHA